MAQEWEPGKYLLIDYAGDKILLNSSRSNAVKTAVSLSQFFLLAAWFTGTPLLT